MEAGAVQGVEIEEGRVKPRSGTLRRYTWDPTDEELDPLQYDFWPTLGTEL